MSAARAMLKYTDESTIQHQIYGNAQLFSRGRQPMAAPRKPLGKASSRAPAMTRLSNSPRAVWIDSESKSPQCSNAFRNLFLEPIETLLDFFFEIDEANSPRFNFDNLFQLSLHYFFAMQQNLVADEQLQAITSFLSTLPSIQNMRLLISDYVETNLHLIDKICFSGKKFILQSEALAFLLHSMKSIDQKINVETKESEKLVLLLKFFFEVTATVHMPIFKLTQHLRNKHAYGFFAVDSLAPTKVFSEQRKSPKPLLKS